MLLKAFLTFNSYPVIMDLPIESRIDQLMSRIDFIAADGEARPVQTTQVDGQQVDFRAMVAMMQSEMVAGMDNDKPKQVFPSYFNQYTGGMNAFNFSQMPAMNRQQMQFPLQGRISSDYGQRVHPITGHTDFHNGVDIAAEQGSAIRAPYDGRVSFVGDVPGFGENTVIVAHENQRQADGKILYSVFGHNQDVFVQEGQQVNQGEIFATVGNEGHSTGPHLHWETRYAPPGLSGTQIFEQHLSMTVDPLNLA